MRVEAGARLDHCIIDKNVIVPPRYLIGEDIDADRQRFTLSDRGVVVVAKERNLQADSV